MEREEIRVMGDKKRERYGERGRRDREAERERGRERDTEGVRQGVNGQRRRSKKI